STSSSVVKAALATTTTNTTRATTTPHVVTVDLAAAVTTPATPAPVILTINPAISVFTPTPSTLSASGVNAATAILTRANVPHPVVQSLARATTEPVLKSLSGEAPLDIRESPVPGIFFTPSTPAEPGDVAPMLAAPGARLRRSWEQSIDLFLQDETNL